MLGCKRQSKGQRQGWAKTTYLGSAIVKYIFVIIIIFSIEDCWKSIHFWCNDNFWLQRRFRRHLPTWTIVLTIVSSPCPPEGSEGPQCLHSLAGLTARAGVCCLDLEHRVLEAATLPPHHLAGLLSEVAHGGVGDTVCATHRAWGRRPGAGGALRHLRHKLARWNKERKIITIPELWSNLVFDWSFALSSEAQCPRSCCFCSH